MIPLSQISHVGVISIKISKESEDSGAMMSSQEQAIEIRLKACYKQIRLSIQELQDKVQPVKSKKSKQLKPSQSSGSNLSSYDKLTCFVFKNEESDMINRLYQKLQSLVSQ